MPYQHSVVTFVDILGFADLVRREGPDEIVEMMDAMNETAASPVGVDGLRTSVVTFSDSVIRARPIGPESLYEALLHEIQDLATAQWTLLEFGLLIRGGTTVGDVSVAEGRAFGPGFVQAYRLESSLASSPRIILDPGVVQRIRGYLRGVGGGAKTELITGMRDHIRLGDDGVWFVDYINSVRIVSGADLVRAGLPGIRDFIIRQAQRFADEPLILPKYLWQIRYYNQSIDRYFPEDRAIKIRASDVPASDQFRRPRAVSDARLTS